jgi:hypothetical protein
MAIDLLPANSAFDAETTKVLASAFDAAWEKIKASDGSLTDKQQAAATRELLAKSIIKMVEQGERNPIRLVENAVGRLARNDG